MRSMIACLFGLFILIGASGCVHAQVNYVDVIATPEILNAIARMPSADIGPTLDKLPRRTVIFRTTRWYMDDDKEMALEKDGVKLTISTKSHPNVEAIREWWAGQNAFIGTAAQYTVAGLTGQPPRQPIPAPIPTPPIIVVPPTPPVVAPKP